MQKVGNGTVNDRKKNSFDLGIFGRSTLQNSMPCAEVKLSRPFEKRLKIAVGKRPSNDPKRFGMAWDVFLMPRMLQVMSR